MNSILSVQNLSTGYGKRQVLFGVSFEVARGEALLVTGGNGSGKSTLLRATYGLLPVWNEDAEIRFQPDPDGPSLPTNLVARNLSNGLGYLLQKNAVFDDLTVDDNLRLSGQTLPSAAVLASRRSKVITMFPMLVPHLHRRPRKMSGGERQLLALAMVLLHEPRLLLLDEPLTGLDRRHTDILLRVLVDLRAQLGLTMIIAEQRVAEMVPLGARRMEMYLGELSETDTRC